MVRMRFVHWLFIINAIIFTFTFQVQANTMWMTRGGANQSEDVVGADGTTGALDLNFGFDYKNVSTNLANGSSTGDRPSFRVKIRYNGTGSSGGSVGDSVANPGLVLEYDQFSESYPLTNGVPLLLILHDGVAASTLDSTTVSWDNKWHRIAIQWDATAQTASVIYDEITVLGPVSVPTATYDMSGRNFVVNGYHRLEGADINFDNLKINDAILEDFESLADGAGVSGDWVILNRFDFMKVNGAEQSNYVIQPPAFPGAEGFGAYANGGRGGDVYTVVNLNSSGEGSLRYGVENVPSSGRTIVFAVSGYIPINYNSDTGNQTVRIVQNNVTIAGQTAPGDGIGLKDGRILITGNNAALRHLRIRHGKYGGAGDCLNIESSADDCMIDHVSLMFSTDENISFFNSSVNNFTMQYSTSSWGMERHNAGGLWDLQDGSCHHSLWAHHRTRNPKARPNGLLEWINNVTFHWRSEGFIMGDSETATDWYANVRGCYFLSIADFEFGLKSTALSKARIASDGEPNFHLYLDNCLHDADGDGMLNGTDKGYDIVDGEPYNPAEGAVPGTVRYDQSATPFTGAPMAVTIDDPLTAYKKVISSAGALRLDAGYANSLRDELDTLLIDSVENQESILVAKDDPVLPSAPPSNGEAQLAEAPYNITNGGFGTLNAATAPTDTDGDGMPDYWEQSLGSNPEAQDHNTAFAHNGSIITESTFFPPSTPSGYTWLEEYLHFCAIPHASIARNVAGQPSSISVDLRKYTRGFSDTPEFTISGVYGGTIQQFAADGVTPAAAGPIVEYTPTLNFFGRAGFDFNVTDADGSSWIQSFGLLVDVTRPVVPMLGVHYKMEGNVNDSSGNNNHGVTTGSPAYVAGQVGLAIDLDGADDLITLPSGVAGSEDITVAAWVNWDGGDPWQRIFDFGNDTDQYMYLTPGSSSDMLRFAITDTGNAGEQSVETSLLTAGRWAHIALTLEGNFATLYVNGQSAAVNDAITVNPDDFNPAMNYIGDSQWPSDPLFNGRIDDFRIYNYALSAAEVYLLANPANTATSSVWWLLY